MTIKRWAINEIAWADTVFGIDMPAWAVILDKTANLMYEITESAWPSSTLNTLTKDVIWSTSTWDFKADGSVPMTGDLDMGTNKLINLDTPTADTDGATKKYVDDNAWTWDVAWPASAVDENIAVYDGITWDLLKDGWSKISDLLDKTTYDPSTIAKDLFAVSQVVYVDITNWDDIGWNGNINAPYQTIPAAIAWTTWLRLLTLYAWTYPDDFTLDGTVTAIKWQWASCIISGKMITNGTTFFRDIQFIRSSTVTETFIDATTNISQLGFDFCLLQLTTGTDDIQPTLLDIAWVWSSVVLTGNDIVYYNASTAANSASTSTLKIWAGTFTVFNWNSMYIDIFQSSWDYLSIDDAGDLIITITGIFPLINVYSATYSWECAFYRSTASALKRILSSEIIMTWNGSGTWVAYCLDSAWQTINASNNAIKITWFASNVHADMVWANDTILSFNEDNIALDWVIWAGTYQQDKLWDFFNGSVEELVSFTTSSDWVTITASVEADWGWDLTLRYGTGRRQFESTPAATIALTPGTDTVPLTNYVFVPASTWVLTTNTTWFPSPEHTKLGIVECFSAATHQTDWAKSIQSTVDELNDPADNGHNSHVNSWLRDQFGTYKSGMDESITWSGTATVTLALTWGSMRQLHLNSSPAYADGTDFRIVNDPTTPYLKWTNLATALTQDSLWGSINSKYIAVVLWQIVSSTESESKLFFNLPSWSYSTEIWARDDINKYTNYNIPLDDKNTAVLIHRYILRKSGSNLTEFPWAWDDIRGLTPSVSAGWGWGGGWVTDWTWLSDTPWALIADKFSTVNTWGTSLELVKTVPTWDVLGTSDTQTLTNKTLTDPKIITSINQQVWTTYTLVLTDASKSILANNAAAQAYTIPLNASVAYPAGTTMIVTMYGDWVVTITWDTGVTVNWVSGGWVATVTQYDTLALEKIDTDEWLILWGAVASWGWAADALNSATTEVDVSAATAPTTWQILTATSSTAATWQTPAGWGDWTLIDTATYTAETTKTLTITGWDTKVYKLEYDLDLPSGSNYNYRMRWNSITSTDYLTQPYNNATAGGTDTYFELTSNYNWIQEFRGKMEFLWASSQYWASRDYATFNNEIYSQWIENSVKWIWTLDQAAWFDITTVEIYSFGNITGTIKIYERDFLAS